MARDCESFPGKRVVLVTVSSDYFEMFTNWMDSAKPFLHDSEQLLVIAEDVGIVAPLNHFLQGKGVHYSVALTPQKSSLLQASSPLWPPWGSEHYGTVVWERPDHIMRLLSAGCSVLYVDVDTVWMKDPFHEIEAMGFAELYITDDSPPEHFRNLCTCFLFFHPTVATKAFIQSWSAAMEGDSNQRIFNHVLQKARFAKEAPMMRILPVNQFPPGNLILLGGTDRQSEKILDTTPADPTVYHANWRISTADKVHFFQVLDVWKPKHRASS